LQGFCSRSCPTEVIACHSREAIVFLGRIKSGGLGRPWKRSKSFRQLNSVSLLLCRSKQLIALSHDSKQYRRLKCGRKRYAFAPRIILALHTVAMEFSRDILGPSQYSLHAVQRTFSMSHESIRQQCPHCLASYKIGSAFFGKRVKCGKCGKEFRASSPPPPPPLNPTPSSAEESERFTINTDTPRRQPPQVGSTKSQNINRAIMISSGVFFVLLLLGAVLDQSRGDSSKPVELIVTLLFGPILLVAVGLAYFFPTIIAYSRDHNNLLPILVINFVFGWTLLGWVGCLAWALSSDIKESRVHIRKVIVQSNAVDDD